MIFQETLLGPKVINNFDSEFVKNYQGIPDLGKELAYFAKNPFNPSQKLKIDMFIEFIIFDQDNIAHIKKGNNILKILRKERSLVFYDNKKFLLTIEEEIELKKSKFKVFEMIENDKQEFFDFTPPVFGVTMLGSSHGFDVCGSTSGFILWINENGIMVDPPPFSSKALREMGIPPNYIKKIIITHCHADHDSGAFHKIIEAAPIEFLSTKTIFNSFIRKYSAISEFSEQELKKLFSFRYITIGHPLKIHGAEFKFSYSFHSIPALRFEVSFKGKRFYFSSDTFFDPPKLKEIQKQGVLSVERFKNLADVDFSQYDLILHEAGIPPIHTPISVLQNLSPEIKENIFLYHVASKDIKDDTGLKKAEPGLKNTI